MSKGARAVRVKDDSTPFIIYHPYPCHKLPPMSQDIPSEGIVTTSIDIGIKNFAIRLERRFSSGIAYPIYFDKIDFTKYGVDTSDSSGTSTVDPRVLNAATEFMKTVLPHIKESRLIGIERQMAINTKATKMFQHILTTLLIYAPQFTYPDCIIFDIWAKLKGKMLGVPQGLNTPALKEWTINRVLEILENRGDTWSINVINHHRGKTKTKADDLADTVAQMEAFFILNKGAITPTPIIINL